MPERDANQLAADGGVDILRVAEKFAPEVVYLRLKELEALVGTLQQERNDAETWDERTRTAWDEEVSKRVAAEAALAETNQAWAATGRKLASTRQALTELAETNWTGIAELEEMSSWVRDIALRALAATEDTP